MSTWYFNEVNMEFRVEVGTGDKNLDFWSILKLGNG